MRPGGPQPLFGGFCRAGHGHATASFFHGFDGRFGRAGDVDRPIAAHADGFEAGKKHAEAAFDRTMAAKLEKAKDNAELSYTLATIKTDVALEQQPDALANAEPDREALLDWFTRLEFKSWVDELLTGEGEANAVIDKIIPAVTKLQADVSPN